ncbi:4-alpha-glucanotransferase [Halogeometricum sp. S1BR25-6]|uniref:4-alpha-glucanotransferase n=1 Tax=Halogeometricum salsisoli TaxID=2950536 RepID=A0ABU2GDX6_9EURY|nr:4-alpha-glucanotransferase [Halogeometricum sp. S1BR25-6]MDS0299005.1 4-alpha-glucanotransferase [Halogeometricum sp. S1BR25-6]
MRFDRQSGVFMHVTSLPGAHGIGDLGDGARAFVDWLASAEQSLWQFCPLGPTASIHGDSPYQSYSAFAGNPLLVDLRRLRADGYLTDDDLEPVPDFSPHDVEYDRVREYKTEMLRTAHDRFESEATDEDREAFEAFRERESAWLDGYALFMALRTRYDGAWIEWPQEIRTHDEGALERHREDLADEVAYREFVQFVFDRQWRDLKEYANEQGVELVGDLPIYVALDSADVWASPEAFDLTEENEPAAVAGVPPNPGDDGQRWGNPLYDWEYLCENGYDWWMDRLDRLFELVDVTRIDHFKGFDEYWAIPADAHSPAEGEWRQGPGADFFEAAEARFGDLPFIVEDLGFIDQSMVDLRDRFGFPGMRVPQYADWCQQGDMYQPMHFPDNSVGYTSTHDTNTFVGYYRDLPDRQKDCLHYNVGADGSEIHWSVIDAVWRSNAVIAFTTIQDVLGLGSEARFNLPGTAQGNWRWRCTREGFDADAANRLASLTDEHIRN